MARYHREPGPRWPPWSAAGRARSTSTSRSIASTASISLATTSISIAKSAHTSTGPGSIAIAAEDNKPRRRPPSLPIVSSCPLVPPKMATHRDAKFPDKLYIESAPLPAEQPVVREVGSTSAPLKSASFFIGEACKSYNEDFMLCKNENEDPAHCLKEGRRVTRCAQDLIRKLSDSCGKQWEDHWQCLENHNQEFYKCRKPERTLNQCVFDKLNLAKKIPGTPEGKEQVHELKRPVWR